MSIFVYISGIVVFIILWLYYTLKTNKEIKIGDIFLSMFLGLLSWFSVLAYVVVMWSGFVIYSNRRKKK